MLKISENIIEIGKPLPWDCYDTQGLLLLRKGFVVENPRQITALIERGLFADETGSAAIPEVKKEEPASPFQIIDSFKYRLQSIFESFSSPKDAEIPQRVIRLCADIQKICKIDADATLGYFHLAHTGERYTVVHPLHIAVLCEVIGQKKGLAGDERMPLLAAALTANIGMLDLQEKLQLQTAPLTREQHEAIRLHPLHTVEKLMEAGIQEERWIKTVLHHHEKLDGSGYPGALKGDDLTLLIRIVSLADTYSAMITPRVYRGHILAQEALRDIFLKRGAEIDPGIAQLFIKELGVFPPGACVRLHNGEIAVVIKRSTNRACPIVQSLIGPRGAPLPVPVKRDTSQPNNAIKEMVVPDQSMNLDPHKLWGYRAKTATKTKTA
jgi:HD-GYP domain-containing protein (c-di-GMP phosphodiesterase class II)